MVESWLREERLRVLIAGTRERSAGTSEVMQEQVGSSLDRVEGIINARVEGESSKLLVISATCIQLRKLERLVLDGLRMDYWLPQSEEIELVYIRLMCAEMLGILRSASDDLKHIPAESWLDMFLPQ